MLATELNGKRAVVKPIDAQRWAQLTHVGTYPDDTEDFEPTDSPGTPPVPATKNGRGKSTDPDRGAPARAGAEVTTREDSTAAADVRKIPLVQLEQHPANPDPSEQEIVETMNWLLDGGQLEPLIVRPDEYVDGRSYFQVLAGKRRCLAAARLGWTVIECRVREDLAGDNRAALAVMAATNAQRHVETPIRQALMLKAMIDAGMSHEEAGKIYGLESKSGVVNKLRLLQLPEVWHQRLASAEISERAVRQLIPFVGAPRVMAAIDKAWKDDQRHSWSQAKWLSEAELRSKLKHVVDNATRPIEKTKKHRYSWELGYDHPRYFELTPEVEAKLDVVELPLGKNGAAVKVATNATEYDKHNVPLIKAKQKEKERARSAGGKPAKTEGDSKKPPTAAELKAKRQAADKQTARRVEEWRHRFLRFAASQRLEAGNWKTGLLAPWLMQATRGGSAPIDDFFRDALVMMNLTDARGRNWGSSDRHYADDLIFSHVITAVDADGDPVREVEDVQMLLCKWLLWPATNVTELQGKLEVVATEGQAGERLPPIEDEDVEAICRFLEVDLKNAWDNFAHRNAFGAHFVEQFFELHTKDQLADLVEELKIDDLECKTKGDLVAAFVAQHTSKSPLKMPKAIAPLAGAGKAKKGRKR